MGRSLAVKFRLLSSLFVTVICTIYADGDEIPLHAAFGLFLFPVILSVLLFGGFFAYFIPILSSVSLLYFVIPPRNSFAIATTRDFLNLCAFISLAWITWGIVTLQSIITGIEED
jgi:K+-sensing histidine kinase KdpD